MELPVAAIPLEIGRNDRLDGGGRDSEIGERRHARLALMDDVVVFQEPHLVARDGRIEDADGFHLPFFGYGR